MIDPQFFATRTAATLASLGSAAAGLYLLLTQAVGDNSLLETLAHGIGLYFLAKAFYIGPALNQAVRQTMLLERLAGVSRDQSEKAAAGVHPPEVQAQRR
jgi:hypothetical protein